MNSTISPINTKFTAGKDELLACLEIGKLLTSTYDYKKIIELIMTKGRELIKAQHWSLLLKDEQTGKLSFEIVVGAEKTLFTPIILAPDDGIAPYVAHTGTPLFVPDVTKEPRFNKHVDEKTGFRTESIVCIPLSIHGKVSGVIEIVNIEDMDFFGAKDYPILTILADYTAIAIENSKHVSKIEKLSITDEYTGLYNARYMHDFLDTYFRETKNQRSNIAVLFLDIDNFKEIVDRYGHMHGSDVLKQVGDAIKSVLAHDDILIKYGGDEYVILLPGRSCMEGVTLAGHAAQVVRTTSFSIDKTATVRVTASFGVAAYPENASDKKTLLIAADNALFKIKNTTKDSIGIA